MSLALLGHVASNLGRNDEAVEAALLSVRLEETLPVGAQQVIAHNYLGLAYAWCRSFDRADAAFDTAARISDMCVPVATSFQPRLNQVWAEALRLVSERYLTTRLPSLDKMHAVADVCLRSIANGDTGGLRPSAQALSHAMARLGSALRHGWAGNLDRAQADLSAARSSSERMRASGPLNAMLCWVQAELAWVNEDWTEAARQATTMTDLASRIEHEQLAGLGQLIASQIYEIEGKDDMALAELRELRHREQHAHAASLESRARLVKWQMRSRQTSHGRFQTRPITRFEAIAEGSLPGFEDSLTGLSTRRCAQDRLATALQRAKASDRTWCVARIGVDDFAQLCEAHSALVGNQVLKGVATVIKAHLREDDFAARLGIDEFALVLHDTDAFAARSACERIAGAVSQVDWQSVAAGLNPGVAFTAACAERAESVHSLFVRLEAMPLEANSAGDEQPTPVRQ